MALQNVRSLLWRGEDLGYGGGNTREQIFSVSVPAGARPQLATYGFTNSVNLSAYFPGVVSTASTGQLRAIMNRSPDYWVTFMATYVGGPMLVPVSIPIPPLQQIFLPQNIVGPAMVVANSAWPIPLPPSGAASTVVPLATSTSVLTIDVLVET